MSRLECPGCGKDITNMVWFVHYKSCRKWKRLKTKPIITPERGTKNQWPK